MWALRSFRARGGPIQRALVKRETRKERETYRGIQMRDKRVLFEGFGYQIDELVNKADEGENVFGGLLTADLREQEALEER